MQRILVTTFISLCVGLTGVANGEEIEEIVVTAQKRAQGANDVGITLNTFTGEQLKELGFKTAEDIAALTPGLTTNYSAALGVPVYTIRAVGYQDYNANSSSTVGLYFDGVAIPYTVMSRGLMFDVDRVEVLKGPQGDLYGRNTTAGQINFVNRKPTENFEAGITAGYSSYRTVDLEGFVSGSMSDDVRGRVAIRSVTSSEGWQESLTRSDELGELDTFAVRAMLDIDLSEDVNLLLNVHYVDDQSENLASTAYDGALHGGDTFVSPYTPLEDYFFAGETPPWYSTGDAEDADWTNSYTSPQTGRTFSLRPERDNQLFGASATLEWQIGDMTLTSITAFNQFDRVEANDWDGGSFNDSANINTTDLSVFSQEVRLAGGDDDLNWIIGGYYSSDEMDEYYHYFMSDSVYGFGSIPWGVGLFAATPILELDTKQKQETDSLAVFGHVEWRFADAWRLTVGARYTSEERDWSGCTFVADDGTLAAFLNANFGSSLGVGDCGTIDDDPNSPAFIFAVIGTPNVNDAFHVYSDTIDTDRLMGKVTLDYAVNDDVLLYGTVSNGFKSGGFNGANSNTTLQLHPIEEEVLTAYEVGVKATLLDNTMQVNAATFFYDYQDKQETDAHVAFVGNISGLTNAPESEIKGIELDMLWLPGNGWDVRFNIAWLDSEVTEWMAVDTAASAWPNIVYYDASGNKLAMSPDISYTASVSKGWQMDNGAVIDITLDHTYTDSTTGATDPFQIGGEDYRYTNMRVGYGPADGKWRLVLWGRNITDEYYWPMAYLGGNGPFVRMAGMPRTYGLSVDLKFGS